MATEKVILNQEKRKAFPWQLKVAGPVILLLGSIAGFNALSENASTGTIPLEAKLPDFCLDTEQSPEQSIWCRYAQDYPILNPVLDNPHTLHDESTKDIMFDACLASGRAPTLADVSVLGNPTTSVRLLGKVVNLSTPLELQPVWTTVTRGIMPTQVPGPSGNLELAAPFAVEGLDNARGLQLIWLTQDGDPYQLAAEGGCLDPQQPRKDGTRLSLRRSFFLPNF